MKNKAKHSFRRKFPFAFGVVVIFAKIVFEVTGVSFVIVLFKWIPAFIYFLFFYAFGFELENKNKG